MRFLHADKPLAFVSHGGAGAPAPRPPSPLCDARRAVRTVALAFSLAAGAAHAGYITQPELALDRIFSQASFGGQRVDVRFNAPQTLYSAALASVDSSADLWGLFSRATAPGSIHAFFVDEVDWCGAYSTSIIGCGEMPGNALVVESRWAASPSYGAALIAHEGGHNLGLGHSSASGNLMYGSLTGGTALTTDQVSTVLASPLVQWRDGLYTLAITPIAVVASGAGAAAGAAAEVGGAMVTAVPEPATALLVALGLGIAAACFGRRRRVSRSAQRGSVRVS